MSVKKWIPWNWFKKEDEDVGTPVPVKHAPGQENRADFGGLMDRFHRDIDNFFDQMIRGFGFSPLDSTRLINSRMNDVMLKPTLDLAATEKDYTITIEIPGVDEKDVNLEIANDILTIHGEKRQESEEKGKNYYRMERSYGSFQRVLSLPEDVDQDGITATFKNGVLNLNMPRKALANTNVKKIEVYSG